MKEVSPQVALIVARGVSGTQNDTSVPFVLIQEKPKIKFQYFFLLTILFYWPVLVTHLGITASSSALILMMAL